MGEALPGGMRSVKDVVALSSAYLAAKGSPTARLDAELLIGRVLELDRLELYLYHDRPVTPAELDQVRPLLRRRADLEPIAYILGSVGFHHVILKCDVRALVPRAETETLVEIALACLTHNAALLDVGTGAGAIAIAVRHARPDVVVTALDVSSDALALAQENATAVGAEIIFHLSDLTGAVVGETFDVVAANLPYIAADDPRVELGVVRYEPHLALYSGSDGLDLIRRLVAEAQQCLRPGGSLILEVADDQGARVIELLSAAGYVDSIAHRDLAGVDRVVVAQWQRRGR